MSLPTQHRIPEGVRTLTDYGLIEVLNCLPACGHSRLIIALTPILIDEQERRTNPAEVEPAWPMIDLTEWTCGNLLFGASSASLVMAYIDDRAARVFMRDVAHVLLMELRSRIGDEFFPVDDTFLNRPETN